MPRAVNSVQMRDHIRPRGFGRISNRGASMEIVCIHEGPCAEIKTKVSLPPPPVTLHVAASVVSRRFGQRRNGLIARRPDSEAAAMKLQPKHGPDARADPARRFQAKEAPGTVDDPAAATCVNARDQNQNPPCSSECSSYS